MTVTSKSFLLLILMNSEKRWRAVGVCNQQEQQGGTKESAQFSVHAKPSELWQESGMKEGRHQVLQ